MGTRHPWFSFSVLLATVGLLLYVLRRGSFASSIRQPGGGYFRVDEKNGLLGGNNGKKE